MERVVWFNVVLGLWLVLTGRCLAQERPLSISNPRERPTESLHLPRGVNQEVRFVVPPEGQPDPLKQFAKAYVNRFRTASAAAPIEIPEQRLPGLSLPKQLGRHEPFSPFIPFHREMETTRCFGEYGCFTIDAPWTSASRPISLLPESPDKINPIFCLYTRKNPTNCQVLRISMTESEIYRTNISPNRRLVLISHGFVESGEKPWIKQMTAELLKHSDLNVIIINWAGGSAPPYVQAVANTRVVGTMAAHLVNYLDSLGIKARDCHVIGHGLGSHIAGYIGQVLRDKFYIRLARISALDPAQPHFTKTNPIVRLDPTDADFIDVTHTDAAPFIERGLGLLEPVGHIDFYPNGGIKQPGCNEGIDMESGSLVRGLEMFLGCNHIRSHQFYTESINSKCPFIGISCDSWEQFQNGSCFHCATEITPQSRLRGERLCTRFGYGSLDDLMHRWHGTPLKLSQEKLFLMTNSDSPFCQEHYRITLHISGSAQSMKHGAEIGMFWVTLLGEDGSSQRMQLTASEQPYEPDSYHRFVVAGKGVGKLRSAFIEWEYRMSSLNPMSWRFLGFSEIYLESIVIDHLESDQSIALCVPDGNAIVSSDPVLLHHTDSCRQQHLTNNRP